jgi:hypothetical protein
MGDGLCCKSPVDCLPCHKGRPHCSCMCQLRSRAAAPNPQAFGLFFCAAARPLLGCQHHNPLKDAANLALGEHRTSRFRQGKPRRHSMLLGGTLFVKPTGLREPFHPAARPLERVPRARRRGLLTPGRRSPTSGPHLAFSASPAPQHLRLPVCDPAAVLNLALFKRDDQSGGKKVRKPVLGWPAGLACVPGRLVTGHVGCTAGRSAGAVWQGLVGHAPQ